MHSPNDFFESRLLWTFNYTKSHSQSVDTSSVLALMFNAYSGFDGHLATGMSFIFYINFTTIYLGLKKSVRSAYGSGRDTKKSGNDI